MNLNLLLSNYFILILKLVSLWDNSIMIMNYNSILRGKVYIEFIHLNL
jgi:hypothetical protein